MNNKTPVLRETAFQKVCKALDVLFVSGLAHSRENAELWEEWARLREGFAKALFGSVALAPMILVTLVIGDLYRPELKHFPDFIRVVLVEAVLFMAVMYYQLYNLLRCVSFKAWLKLNGYI
jgi:hypothetical protein